MNVPEPITIAEVLADFLRRYAPDIPKLSTPDSQSKPEQANSGGVETIFEPKSEQ